MKLILLSGGSGKRLWPLSNDSRSKQFLKVLEGKDGYKESMLQRVWRQLTKADLASSSVIATGMAQVDILKSQLGNDIQIIEEPVRRDTFAAIALSSSFLHSELECSPDETVIVLPVDPYVEDHFFESIKKLEDILNESDSNICLMGVKPTFPSQKYGYIVPETEKKNGEFVNVSHFQEKPNEKKAQELIEQKALWNCGVFAFKLGYIMNKIKQRNLPTNYQDLKDYYPNIKKNSFDYEIVESEQEIVSSVYQGYWKDLGTWNTLTDEMGVETIGNAHLGIESDNSIIVNELNIPIITLGIKNAIIAASPDGILVTDKKLSPLIKDYSADVGDRPMYEERRWGWYRVLDHVKYPEGNEVLTKRICIRSGCNLSYHVHYKRSETWTVIKGEGTLIFDHEVRHIRAGDTIDIPLGIRHAFRATSDTEIIEVQTGFSLNEEDIYRYHVDWREIENTYMLNYNIKQ